VALNVLICSDPGAGVSIQLFIFSLRREFFELIFRRNGCERHYKSCTFLLLFLLGQLQPWRILVNIVLVTLCKMTEKGFPH
jgi:hypothetical protein